MAREMAREKDKNREKDKAKAEDERAQPALALLAELASSLEASQRALLANDISVLQQATSAQVHLCHALRRLSTSPADQSTSPSVGACEKSTNCPLLLPLPFPSLFPSLSSGTELRAAQERVLQLGRVQAALLIRSGRSLRILAHFLAGPGASYCPPPSVPTRLLHGPEEANLCRV